MFAGPVACTEDVGGCFAFVSRSEGAAACFATFRFRIGTFCGDSLLAESDRFRLALVVAGYNDPRFGGMVRGPFRLVVAVYSSVHQFRVFF